MSLKDKREDYSQELDRGVWSWLTLIGCTFSGLCNGTITYSSAIFHVALLQTFNEGVAYTSLIGSILTSMLYLPGPLASILVQKTSCRFTHCCGGILIFLGLASSYFAQSTIQLFFTYGFLTGLGSGLCATAYSVVPVYRFRKYLGLVVGIQMIGGGVSFFVAGPIIQLLLDMYGLRGAFLILGAFGSNLILCGFLMKPSILEIESKVKESKIKYEKNRMPRCTGKTNICKYNLNLDFFNSLIRNPGVICIFLSSLIWHIPAASFQLHLPNYAVTKGSSPHQAAFLFIICGIASVIGRITTGGFLGPFKVKPLTFEITILLCVGLSTILLPLYSSSYAGQGIYAAIYGSMVGALTTLFSPICFYFAELKDVPTAIGFRYFIGGIAYVIGPPIAGFIVDNGGTYEQGFYLSGSLFLGAGVLDMFSWILRYRKNKQDNMKDRSITVSDKLKESMLSVNNLHGDENKLDACGNPLHVRAERSENCEDECMQLTKH